MISCTEFIPSYSELFNYLENKFGHEEVTKYWTYLFDPTKSALYEHRRKSGIRGCYNYCTHTLNEEAADFTMYLNEKRGFFMIKMHHCPSKGRLLEMQSKIGVPPYHSYCLHCDYYRLSAEACGFGYMYDFEGVEHAACSLMIYDPRIFDGRFIIDDDTEIMDRKAADNEYFHPDFHGALNSGIEYLGSNYGEEAVREYMTQFATRVYGNISEAVKENGLAVLEEKILDTYAQDKAPEAVHTCLDGDTLAVTVDWCPAVRYLTSKGVTMTKWYAATTDVVMETVAKNAGYMFSMDAYDAKTGAAKYRFWK